MFIEGLSYEERLKASKNKRLLMVSGEIKRIIIDLIQRGQIKHPLLIDCFLLINVTKVEVSPNLSSAFVYLTLNDNSESHDIKKYVEAFNSQSREIKSRLRHKITTKVIPNLIFKYDESFLEVKKINDLLDSIKYSDES